ncbi:uncharacterized protein RCC_06217 [Ramularia collo-cygni]|uniref:Suppressor of anucleate metulae protein B n=1 Tax=Ramularia collo-cygni TaxID=112498 RepID=A0A2D3UY48_9PEZI|nr:uncharacterized protein RCC_06217 [Ramularia collo-cygni]CZT20358.1 uncharacterized protein RCC_06217 [Ramularia collo-cygni]
METTTATQPICSVCSREAPQPLLICFNCSEGTDSDGKISLTNYCGTRCRDGDDSNHAGICKLKNNRKALYRAGEILQAAFYIWREVAFDINIESVWKNEEGILCYREREYDSGVTLYRFPDHLIPDSRDKVKILSFIACTDAQTHMFELSKRLLEGLVTNPCELTVTVDPECLTVHRYYDWGLDQETFDHEVIEVVLGGDSEASEGYVIDMAGAQHGQFKAVVPSRSYIPDCAERAVRRKGLQIVWAANVEMRKRMKVAMDDWEREACCTVQLLPRCRMRKYEEGKATLLARIRGALEQYVDELEVSEKRSSSGNG